MSARWSNGARGRRSRARAALGMGALAALALSPLLALDCASGLRGAKALDASTPEGATAASNAFGFDIYARIKQDGDNLICSPFSAAVALNMASAGARGQTRDEMLSVLHVDPQRAAETHASFGGLLGALNARDGTDGVALHVADRLWGQAGTGFKPDFLALLRDSYGAPLETVDFAHATAAARATINHWVATQTHDRIPEILGDGDLGTTTRLVLTNAVYFKGKWETPFRPEETKPRRFTGVAGAADVPMMAQQATFAYARAGDVQLVELPYAGDLSMVVLLPDGAGDLPALERKVARSYADWLAALRPTEVNLWLPRWTFNSRVDLDGPLQAAGMRLVFRENADLSGTSNAAQLYIDKVLQEAFVEVNETGTEAAAATAVDEAELSAFEPTPPPKVFHADHPFLYLIRDQKTGVVLFLGRVAGLSG
jgi:serpin B